MGIAATIANWVALPPLRSSWETERRGVTRPAREGEVVTRYTKGILFLAPHFRSAPDEKKGMDFPPVRDTPERDVPHRDVPPYLEL